MIVHTICPPLTDMKDPISRSEATDPGWTGLIHTRLGDKLLKKQKKSYLPRTKKDQSNICITVAQLYSPHLTYSLSFQTYIICILQ